MAANLLLYPTDDMLDDLKNIELRDKSDSLGIAAKQWQQLKHDFGQVPKPAADNLRNIVLAGMGGSALAAAIARAYTISEPFEVVRDYDIPEYVGGDTLFIASSYSGNTEETLAALEQARAKGAKIVVIASGGKLAEIAQSNQYPLYRIPEGLQPRMAVFYNLAALTQLFVTNGLLSGETVVELHKVADWLGDQTDMLLPTVPTSQNPAKQLALELVGKSIVMYSGPKLAPAAYKWKINFNENAKNIAWYNQYPEFNHNEFLGWTSHPVDKPYAVVELRSNLEHERIQKRFEVTEKLLSGKRPHPQVVEAQGETILQQLLWTIQVGDFVSLYLAILNGLDPTPVDLIEKLKTELAG